MSKLIQMDSIEFISATYQARAAAYGIDGNLDTWTSQGEKSTALEAFAEQYVEMEKTMKLFKSLLQADLQTMNDIGEKFLLADLNLTALWK